MERFSEADQYIHASL